MKQRARGGRGDQREEKREEGRRGRGRVGSSRRIRRYHGVYGGRERGDSKGAVRRRPGCAQQVEGELSVEGTSAAAVAVAVAAVAGGGGGRETGREAVKREHEGWREGIFGRVRGWVGDWHLISGRMTAAASGSIRRPRGQCAGGSDPLSTPPRLFLHHLLLHLLLLLSTYRPLCFEQSTPGRTELVCFVCRAKPFCSPPTARVERNRSGW